MTTSCSFAPIPLLCNICPKGPVFSDVSHLLTHVASKAHLSHYYKIKVRSGTESAARDQLSSYDRWYADNGVEQLMSERMSLKESKKTGLKNKAERDHGGVASRFAASTSHHSSRQAKDPPTIENTNTVLDPQLSRLVKQETLFFESNPSVGSASQHRAHIPRMHLWPTATNRLYESPRAVDDSPHTDTPSASAMDFCQYETPSMQSDSVLIYRPNSIDGPHSVQSEMMHSPRSSTIETAAHGSAVGDIAEEELEDWDEIDESTKLKGVYWPGMAVFDSATADNKRKRNQKKDVSILEQMKINSAEVTPTEFVFNPDGSLKKQRRISGLVEEDSSPVECEKALPKKRGRKGRNSVLAEISGNVQKVRKSARTMKPNSYGGRPRSIELGVVSKRALATLDGPPTTALYGEGCYFDPTEDDNEELKLTIGGLRPRRKPGFTIFDDQESIPSKVEDKSTTYQNTPNSYSQHPQYGCAYQDFGHPHGFSFLNSDFRLTSPSENTAVSIPPFDATPESVPSFFRPNYSHQPGKEGEKENMKPSSNGWGHVDDHPGFFDDEMATQRYFSMECSQPPHFYHCVPQYMQFGAFGSAEQHGVSYNPLIFSYQQADPNTTAPHLQNQEASRVRVSPRRPSSRLVLRRNQKRILPYGTTVAEEGDEQILPEDEDEDGDEDEDV
ncbi:MAG: hypothetical protein M1827_003063 [Pycnora praestabilis]|nr:MAG: hypothetical protein M1827_003063 [Pycnora praestabilis]